MGGDESLSENSSETPVPAANAPTAASTSTSHARRRRLIADPLYPLPGVSGTVVMKFGGTSVADAERIKRAARRIVAKREPGTASSRCCRRAARRPTS